MERDPAQVRRLARAKTAENIAFRRYLRRHHRADELFYAVAREIEAQIDCRSCANCCRTTRVELREEDLIRLAGPLSGGVAEARQLYCTGEPGGDGVCELRQQDDHCFFLAGNDCSIYEERPRACREFPHVDTHASSLGSRMESVCTHAEICPILYNALEELKHRLGWPSSHHAHGAVA